MKRILLSAAWLGFLTVYILIGVPYVSFHGDETTQLYSSHDYVTLFIHRDPQALLVTLPIDDDLEYLRIVDSTTSRYTVGLAWHLAGYSEAVLPIHNFNWTTDYGGNLADGRIPSHDLLIVIRIPSALFLALSAAVMFGIGYCFGGLPMAFFVSGLYALNPVILLNGRRALQEGSLLFFGVLTVWIGFLISQRRENGRSVPLLLWIGLTVAGALTLVSKNNGFIYIAAAFLAVFLPELLRLRLRRLIGTGVTLAVCGVLLIALFIALSPGLWSSPAQNMQVAAMARLSGMYDQIQHDPETPTSMQRRVSDILTQPFLRPAAHWESGSENVAEAQSDLIAAYDASLISGIHFGTLLGVPLTALALFGIIANFLPRLRPYRSPSLSVGLLAWLIINLGVLLWLPLPWQRYFLSFVPVATVFAAIGLWSLVRLARSILQRQQPEMQTNAA